MSSTGLLNQDRSGQLLTLTLLLLYVIPTLGTLDSKDAILSRYKPVAMDETVYIVSKNDPHPWKTPGNEMTVDPRFTYPQIEKGLGALPPSATQTRPEPSLLMPSRPPSSIIKQKTRAGGDMSPSEPDTMSETLARSSTEGTKDGLLDMKYIGLTPQLTRLITQQENNKPTFLQPAPVKPFAVNDEPGGKILASYNVIVPILIPPIKKKKPAPAPPPQFVKEVVTEMVPVKSLVPQVKEVYKAEKVPQQLVTSYVDKTKQGGASQRFGDRSGNDLGSGGERVIKETVEMT